MTAKQHAVDGAHVLEIGGQQLHEADLYVGLRQSGDWVALYGMASPQHRQAIDVATFLATYGHGVMEVREIDIGTAIIDDESRTARTALAIEAELVPARLPPAFQQGFHEDHTEHLRRHVDHDLTWTWTDGEWYFDMDAELITGHDADGRPLASLPPR